MENKIADLDNTKKQYEQAVTNNTNNGERKSVIRKSIMKSQLQSFGFSKNE